MAEALISGLISSGIFEPQKITASDTDQPRLKYVKEKYGINSAADNVETVKGNEILMLSVKPQMISFVLAQIGSLLNESQLLISIAAGKKTETIEGQLEGNIPVIRVMPNFNAIVRSCVSLICPGKFAADEHVEVARGIFESIGTTEILDESLFNQATAISGSGPAYFFLITEALTDAAVRVGLPRGIAQKMVIETMIGSGLVLKETGKHPAELKDSVTSPGGTTAAALDLFERCGLRGAILQAVEAAVKRGYELD